MSSKVSVRGIVIRDDNSVVLMHRIKNGQEYRVIPWWGQEERESVEDTLRREIQEELWKSFIVKRDSEVARINKTEWNVDNVQHIFLGHYIEWIFEKDQGIEYIERSNEKNYYNPEFISEHDIFHINIVPKEVKQLLLQILSWNLDKDIIANINLQ
jgi:hypothetical protein